jgi:hypothetical protein
LNLTLGTRDCVGTLALKGKGSFLLIEIGEKVWIKPDNGF